MQDSTVCDGDEEDEEDQQDNSRHNGRHMYSELQKEEI